MSWVGEFPKVREWDGASCPPFLYPKRDGYRVTVVKATSGRVTATTRTPTDLTRELRTYLGAVYERVPPGVALVGELWVPGGDHSQVRTALNARDPSLRWEAFGILGMEGWDPAEVAALPCEDVETTLISWGVPHVSRQRAHGRQRRDPEALLARMREAEAKFDDYEGYVLKDANLTGMQKWKPVRTVDLVVTGLQDGRGKYLGQCGALELSTSEGYPVARCSGMDDDTRLGIGDDWLGVVVEVKYQTVTSKGRLRHPRFARVRDDKPASECDAWQDDRLIRYWHGPQGREEMAR